MTSLVHYGREASVAVVQLDRPERHNSLVPELLERLLEVTATVAASDARVCLLEAAGRSFSTGGDIRGFRDHDNELAEYADRLVSLLNEAILALVDLPIPVVAAVQGAVSGGSLGLVLAADVVLISEHATIAPWYAVVGFSPDGGWTAMLPEVIGRARAAEWQLTNRHLDAEDAVATGIAARVVAHDELAAAAREVCTTIAGMVPSSVRSTRRLLWRDRDAVAARLDEERRAFVAQVTSDDARAGIRRFLDPPPIPPIGREGDRA